MGLQAEFDQIQVLESVVIAVPQFYLEYDEQGPFVTHPAPFVTQVGNILLHPASVVKVTGN